MADLDTTAKRRSAVFIACGAVYPVADGVITEPDRRHVCRTYCGLATVADIVFTLYGQPRTYVKANWTARFFYFEAYMRAVAGMMYARLYDVTASVPVPGTDVSTESATFVQLRSGSVVLTDGHKYQPQFGRIAAHAGETKGAGFVVV